MIPAGVEIFVALAPIDLRWGFDRLAGVATEQLGRVARSGALFVFFGKRKSSLKILFFDGTGMCQFYKLVQRAISRARRGSAHRPRRDGREGARASSLGAVFRTRACGCRLMVIDRPDTAVGS